MQVKVEKNQPKFEPITISLTIENLVEYNAFLKMSRCDLSIPNLFFVNEEERRAVTIFLQQLNEKL